MSKDKLIETESPLKFRIWSNRKKRYLGHSPCLHLVVGRITKMDVDEETKIIEQSTGLKDKNGITVFCGDVLKDNSDALLEVCWCSTLASFMLDEYSYDENGEYTGSGNLDSIRAAEVQEMEIVGNIHEGVQP